MALQQKVELKYDTKQGFKRNNVYDTHGIVILSLRLMMKLPQISLNTNYYKTLIDSNQCELRHMSVAWCLNN